MLNVNELAGFGVSGRNIQLRDVAGLRGPTSTVVVPMPAHEPGDFLIGIVIARNASTINSVPGGWEQRLNTASGGDLATGIFVRRATDSEPSSYTWGSNGGSNAMVGVIVSASGALDLSPVGTVSGTTSLSVTAPSIDRGDDGILFGVFSNKDNARSVTTPPEGMTLLFSLVEQPGVFVYVETPSPGGPSGTRSATWSGAGGRFASVLFQLV